MIKCLLPSVIVILLFSSCSKTLEDRIIGEWKLDEAYRREFFGRDHFQTGFESGKFIFYENGSASYISATDTLNGQWNSDRYTWNGYIDGNYETRSYKYLRLYLVNFQRNKFIDWEFDDFNFRNHWKCIRAVQFSLSRDRVYEFVRQ